MYDVRSKATCYPFIPESLGTVYERDNARLINDICIYIDVSDITQLQSVHNIRAYITAIQQDAITVAVELGQDTIACAVKKTGQHQFMYSATDIFVTHIQIYCSQLQQLRQDTQCRMQVACQCFRLYKRPAMLFVSSAAKPCIQLKETNAQPQLLEQLRFVSTGHNIDIRAQDNDLIIYGSPGLRPHKITYNIYQDATQKQLESRFKRGAITINGLSGDILIQGQGQTYVQTSVQTYPEEGWLHIALLNKRDQ